MLFPAKCVRPVYVVRTYNSSPDETDYVQLELFHKPKDAQDCYRFNKLFTGAENVTISVVYLKFDGWRVVG